MSLRVPKERREVVVFTRNHKIEGEMYLLTDSRISDELNTRAKEFIPVTNAKIFTVNGESLLYTTDFITINKSAIDIVLSKPSAEEI